MIRVVDDFLPNPDAVRAEALTAPYIDWTGHDGEVYRRICICEVPGLRDAIEGVYGPVEMLGMGYRLNFAGEMPNAAVHSDLGWGTHAAVVYLTDGPGGTAFWKHKATGARRIDTGDVDLWHAVRDDWNREEAWEQTFCAPMKFNRGVLYEGANFHSRWPFAAFGTGPEDGRLIAVAFFTPRG